GVNVFSRQAIANLESAHDAIIESRITQTFYANKHCRKEDEFAIGELVYLSTKTLNLPKGQAKKLVPKFVGPFKIIKAAPE
ncbi:hypothetical protein BV25DRAFT_1761986, partial [Artomyces pyxidatus]